MAWKFRPALWPSVATLLLLPLLIGLGIWQLDRADQKAALTRAFMQRRNAPAVDLAAAKDQRMDAAAMRWRKCLLRGRYLADEQYLLDNQIEKGVPGYLVYTPLRLAGSDTIVLVNRGWIPVGRNRNAVPVIPTPSGEVSVRGMAKAPQSAGIALGSGGGEALSHGLVRLQHLDLDAVARQHGWNLLPYVVRLEPEPDSKFVRDWPPPGTGGISRQRHIGYAVQWFLMAVVVLGLYVGLNTKREETT